MTPTKKIINQINELNSELEKLRPEFEEFWNTRVVKSTEIQVDWITMENFITQIVETSLVIPRSPWGDKLSEDCFPPLFKSRYLIYPHTRKSLKPYLRWIFQQILKTGNSTLFPHDPHSVWQWIDELVVMTRIHSILKERKILNKFHYDYQRLDKDGLYHILVKYKIDGTNKSFEVAPELENRFYRGNEDARLLYKSSSLRIVEILSEEAAIYFGQKTDPKWCLSTTNQSRNQFYLYIRGNIIIFLLDIRTREKFCILVSQLHRAISVWDNKNKDLPKPERIVQWYPVLKDILENGFAADLGD